MKAIAVLALALLPLFAACDSDPRYVWYPGDEAFSVNVRDDPARHTTSTRTLSDVNAVGGQFVEALQFDSEGHRISVPSCRSGALCQIGYFRLHEDGSYDWVSAISTIGSYGEMSISCDSGWWTENEPGEVILTSCSGSTYQADWQVTSESELELGAYSFRVSGANIASLRCHDTCEPFFD